MTRAALTINQQLVVSKIAHDIHQQVVERIEQALQIWRKQGDHMRADMIRLVRGGATTGDFVVDHAIVNPGANVKKLVSFLHTLELQLRDNVGQMVIRIIAVPLPELHTQPFVGFQVGVLRSAKLASPHPGAHASFELDMLSHVITVGPELIQVHQPGGYDVLNGAPPSNLDRFVFGDEACVAWLHKWHDEYNPIWPRMRFYKLKKTLLTLPILSPSEQMRAAAA